MNLRRWMRKHKMEIKREADRSYTAYVYDGWGETTIWGWGRTKKEAREHAYKRYNVITARKKAAG